MTKKCPKCKSDNPGTAAFCADCGTQLPSLQDIEVTETMETPKEELTTGSTSAGRYQIIEELGRGGMGPEIAADKKTIDRFRYEMKFARKIRHKNVCQMYDLGAAGGAYFITTEYIAGEDLKKLIRKMGFPSPGQAIAIASQVCDDRILRKIPRSLEGYRSWDC